MITAQQFTLNDFSSNTHAYTCEKYVTFNFNFKIIVQ